MTVNYGTSIVTDGLLYYLDALNTRSYPGTGTAWYDISGATGGSHAMVNNPTYISYDSSTGSMNITRSASVVGTAGKLIRTMTGSLTVGNFAYGTNMSWEIWFRINDVTASNITVNEYNSVLMGYHGYFIGYQYSPSTGLQWATWDGSTNITPVTWTVGTSGTQVLQGSWYQVVVTKSGLTFAGYLNGVASGTLVQPGTLANSGLQSSALTIGAGKEDTSTYNWDSVCNISNIKMYNIVLTAAQIAQNFNAHRGRYGI